jgi:hypothetical protein
MAFQLFLWFELAKLLDDRGDRVVFTSLDDLAALELVWIRVSDKLAQRVEMLSPRDCLIVFFDEWNRQKGADYIQD